MMRRVLSGSLPALCTPILLLPYSPSLPASHHMPAYQERLCAGQTHQCLWETSSLGLPGGPDGKESTCNVREWDSIPELWTEEPGGLQSMRLQRVGHD